MASRETRVSRKVALLIGVSHYGEGLLPLSAAPNDVAALQRVLANPQMAGFDQVDCLIDPELVAMQRAIQQLFSQCQRDDLLLLYFSGHGITDDNHHLYLANCLTSKDDYEATAVPARFIQQQSMNCYTRRQVMILDCCYSGAFKEGWQAKAAGLDLRGELGAEGRVVLTSSTATQTSFQQEETGLSLYTQYLIEGVETGAADTDRDGKIFVHELHDYAKAKVQAARPAMKPEILLDQEGFKILLSKAPLGDRTLEFRRLVEQYASQGEISIYRRETLQQQQQAWGIADADADAIIHSVLEPFQRRLANLDRFRAALQQEVDQQFPLAAHLEADLQDWQRQVLGLADADVAAIWQQLTADKAAVYEAQVLQQQEAARLRQQEAAAQLKQLQQQEAKRLREQEAERLRLQEVAARQQRPPSRPTVRLLTQQQVLKGAGFGAIGLLVTGFGGVMSGLWGGSSGKPSERGLSEKKPSPLLLAPFNFETVTVDQTGKENPRVKKSAQAFTEDLGNGVRLVMVQIPAGSFQMGSPDTEAGRRDSESPQRQVQVPTFLMGTFAVTQAQWAAVAKLEKVKIDLKPEPANFKGNDRPVEQISWDEAVEFCDRLARHTGKPYRLPSEAEWEYACRGGTTTPFHFGATISTDLANYRGQDWKLGETTYSGKYGSGSLGKFRQQTTPVGSFPANAFGLHDMHGNVWEWCADPWHKNYDGAPQDGSVWQAGGDTSYRLLRGGSWDYGFPAYSRSACRDVLSPAYRNFNVGFRVVLRAA